MLNIWKINADFPIHGTNVSFSEIPGYVTFDAKASEDSDQEYRSHIKLTDVDSIQEVHLESRAVVSYPDTVMNQEYAMAH